MQTNYEDEGYTTICFYDTVQVVQPILHRSIFILIILNISAKKWVG